MHDSYTFQGVLKVSVGFHLHSFLPVLSFSPLLADITSFLSCNVYERRSKWKLDEVAAWHWSRVSFVFSPWFRSEIGETKLILGLSLKSPPWFTLLASSSKHTEGEGQSGWTSDILLQYVLRRMWGEDTRNPAKVFVISPYALGQVLPTIKKKRHFQIIVKNTFSVWYS